MAPSGSTDQNLPGDEILRLARQALRAAVLESRRLRPAAGHSALREPGACFVTLKERGALRGCLGSLEAERPLGEDVCANTYAAALQDPRFLPVTPPEVGQILISVSVLTRPEVFPVGSMDALVEQLEPGADGLIVRYRGHRATFLPSVWQSLDSPRDFVDHLWHKAGMPAGFWNEELVMWRYRTLEFSESSDEF